MHNFLCFESVEKLMLSFPYISNAEFLGFSVSFKKIRWLKTMHLPSLRPTIMVMLLPIQLSVKLSARYLKY